MRVPEMHEGSSTIHDFSTDIGKVTFSMCTLAIHMCLLSICSWLDLIYSSSDSSHGKALFLPSVQLSSLLPSQRVVQARLKHYPFHALGGKKQRIGKLQTLKIQLANEVTPESDRHRFQMPLQLLSSRVILGRRPKPHESHLSNLQNGMVYLPSTIVTKI